MAGPQALASFLGALAGRWGFIPGLWDVDVPAETLFSTTPSHLMALWMFLPVCGLPLKNLNLTGLAWWCSNFFFQFWFFVSFAKIYFYWKFRVTEREGETGFFCLLAHYQNGRKDRSCACGKSGASSSPCGGPSTLTILCCFSYHQQRFGLEVEHSNQHELLPIGDAVPTH